MFAGHALKQNTLIKLFSGLKKHTQATLSSDKPLLEKHNQYTLYCATLLIFSSAARPVTDPFCYLNFNELDLGVISINDKDSTEHASFRIVGASKIFIETANNYNKHLLGLACQLRKTFPKTSALLNHIIALHKGNRETGVPYLFLMVNNHKTRSISPKDITDFISNAADIPPNFGRHVIATHALDLGLLSFSEMSLLLGHSPSPQHLLGKESELSLFPVLKKQSKAIDKITDHYQIHSLSGIAPYNSYWVERFTPNTEKHIHSTNTLGPEARVEQRKRRELARTTFVKQLIDYSNLILKSDQHINQQFEAKVNNNLVDNGFPTDPCWQAYFSYLIDTPDALKISPITQHRLKIKYEKNPYSEKKFNDYITLTHTRSKWIAFINNKDNTPKSLTERTAYIVINAALFGRLTSSELLELLPTALLESTYVTKNQCHVELSNQNKEWLTRWQPDLLSSAMISGLTRSKKNNQASSKNELKKVRSTIYALIKEIGITIKKRCPYTSLDNACSIQLNFELPSYLGAKPKHFLYTNLLSPNAFIRLLTGKVPMRFSEKPTSFSLNPSSWQPNLKKRFHHRDFIKTKQAITKLLTSIDTQFRNGQLGKSTRRTSNLIATGLKKISETHDNAPQIVHLLISWGRHLCENGSYREKSLKPSTLKRYIGLMVRSIGTSMIHSNLFAMEEHDFDEQYSAAIHRSTEKDRNTLISQIRSFHQHIQNTQPISDCSWIGYHTAKQDPFTCNSANIITHQEYQRALELIQLDTSLSPRQQTQYLGAIILAYHFGMRVGEIRGLQPRDIQIDEHSRDIWVQVRKRIYGGTKTDAAVRQIPCIRPLESLELNTLKSLITVPERFHKSEEQIGVMSIHADERELIPESQFRGYLNHILKTITQDQNMSMHKCRHNYASILHAALLDSKNHWETDAISLDKLCLDGKFHQRLKAISIAIGHSNISTTVERYIHSKDIYSKPGDRQDVLNQVSKQAMAKLTGESLSSFRSRGKTIQEKIMTSIFNCGLKAMDETGYNDYSVETAKTFLNTADNIILPSLLEPIFFRLKVTDESESHSKKAFFFGISEQQLQTIYEFAEEIEYESNFNHYLLVNIVDTKKQSIAYDSPPNWSEHRRIYQFLSGVDHKLTSEENNDSLEIIKNGLTAWKQIIDSRSQQLITDRERYLVHVLNLCQYLGIDTTIAPTENNTEATLATNHSERNRTKASNTIAYQFSGTVFEKLGNEKALHKAIFCIACWHNLPKQERNP